MKSEKQPKNRYANLLEDYEDYRTGKAKWRTTILDPLTHERKIFWESGPERKVRRARELKEVREEVLKLTQTELAEALSTSARTLQGWESGRFEPPATAVTLIHIMIKYPAVKRDLIRRSKAA